MKQPDIKQRHVFLPMSGPNLIVEAKTYARRFAKVIFCLTSNPAVPKSIHAGVWFCLIVLYFFEVVNVRP